VVVLAGGVGGARFLQGVKAALGLPAVGAGPSEHEITAVVNVGDDIWLHGLRVCPDLDTCMYTLGGGTDTERGWGRAGETWTVGAELAAYDAEPSWFSLGDKDIATHLLRTRMLRAGYPLSAVTEALCTRWTPGVRLLPVTDDRLETHVAVTDPGDGANRAIHFQEWWVRHGAEVPASAIVPIGAENTTPCAEVLAALQVADVVVLAPSNPVVSVGTILAVPGITEALRAGRAPVVGVSPIVGGAAVRGMAERCLAAIGVEASAEAVGRHYGPRSGEGILDGWLVHSGDTASIEGVEVAAVPLLMSSTEATAAMVQEAFDLVGVSVRG
jgi:LPPG:FO 2-phospho-L-lactate transferase